MIKNIIHKIFSNQWRARYFTPYFIFIRNTRKKSYRQCGTHTDLYGPLTLDPHYVTLEEYTRLQPNIQVITAGGTFKVRKYSAIGAGCTVIPGNHIPTVGLPQYLSSLHINDTATEIVVEEDAWVGARCILLSHCHIGRGAVVAAGSTVTKEVLPYAVVAGSPCKTIAVRFSLEQILQHEAILYPPEERLKREYLEELFATHYQGTRTIGTSEISSEDLNKLILTKKKIGIPDYESCQ